jgi:transcriptional regulator of acetoin/glycerol metabolism
MTTPTPTPTTPKKRGRPKGKRNKKRAEKPVERMGWRIAEYAAAHGISRSALYKAIKAGDIKTKKIGKCTIILPD